jgi:hypothetical protein
MLWFTYIVIGHGFSWPETGDRLLESNLGPIKYPLYCQGFKPWTYKNMMCTSYTKTMQIAHQKTLGVCHNLSISSNVQITNYLDLSNRRQISSKSQNLCFFA